MKTNIELKSSELANILEALETQINLTKSKKFHSRQAKIIALVRLERLNNKIADALDRAESIKETA